MSARRRFMVFTDTSHAAAASVTEKVPSLAFYHDCYSLRNDTAHEGRAVDHENLDGAINAYRGLRDWVLKRTLATAQRFPRTAILVHGPAGLSEHGAITGTVEQTFKDIRAAQEYAFWLPHDLNRSFPVVTRSPPRP